MGTKIEEIRGKFVTSFWGLPSEGSRCVLFGFRKDFERVLEGFGRAGGHDWSPKWMKFVDMLQFFQGGSKEWSREGFGCIW